MNPNVPLKECLCCEKVLLPGQCTPRPFLREAELVLLDYVGTTSPFDIESLYAFPKVIGKIGDQEERGFNAEYKVYEEIIKSNLPIYIFYSLKPVNKNEELGDFLLVTKSSVIVLEVKAFELYTNPSEQDQEIIQKILSKQKNKRTQKERVTEEIETFLKMHDCEPLTIHYFTLFANTKRPADTTLNFENALFQDNYLEKIIGLSTPSAKNRSPIESSQYSLRMLLAWFYGTYLKSYIKFGTLKLEEDVIVKRELDEEYKQKAMRMNKDVAGIFLTPAQKVIVESDQPYLQIIGLPGTGKTYCLLLKMVQVFFELWEFRQKSYNSAKDIIIVIHRNDITIQFIKRMFWQTVEKQLERKQLKKKEEMTSLIKFIGGKNLIDIDSKTLFKVENFDIGTKFKIFCDDVSADIIYFNDTNRIYELFKAIEYSNFCWYTSYSVIPMLNNFYRPLSLLKIENNKMSDSGKQLYLTDSLRYSASIHALLDVVLDKNESIDFSHLGIPKFERKNFSPGTRVIGKTPQFVPVKDSKDLKNKVKELLKHLVEEEEIQRSEIAVIRSDVIYEDLLEEIGVGKDGSGAPAYSDGVASYLNNMSAEDLNNDDHFTSKDVHSVSFAFERRNDHCSFSLRGLEVNHVIVCITKEPYSFRNLSADLKIYEVKYVVARMAKYGPLSFTPSNTIKSIFQKTCKQWEDYKMLDLIEAISRATAGVTIFYIDGDQQLSDIANSFQKVFPAICPTSTYKKTYEFDKIIRKSEPLDIETIYELNSVNAAYEFYYFYFSYRLIRFPTNQICSLDVSRDLQCINTLMEELRFDNDSEDSFKYLIIKMMIYGQIIVLLDTIIDNFDDYKHINVWFKPLNKRFDIQLGEDHMKEYLEAWKRKLQATTVKDVISMLEQDGEIHIPKEKENNSAQFKDVQGHPFSSLIRIIVSILETKLFPILPIIAQDYFTSSQGLLTNSQNMNPSGSFFQLNSWSYETISSRKITVFEYTGGKIIDTHFFDGKEGETGIKMIQNKNNERLKQTSEMVFKFISELKPKLNQKDISDKIHNYFYSCLFGSNLPLENDVNSHCQDGFIHMMSNNQRTNFEKFTLVEEINKNCQNDALNDCIEHLKFFLKHRSKICAIELPGGVRGLSRDVLDHVQKLNKIVRGFQKVLLIFNGCKEDTSKIT